jgi:hypothetical protein
LRLVSDEAEPPAGAHAGAVSYGPVLNAAAVLLSC